jgi:hypothetical protein
MTHEITDPDVLELTEYAHIVRWKLERREDAYSANTDCRMETPALLMDLHLN